MNTFRVSKYDNQFRHNGIYQKNEWTSISDIGRLFDGVEFSVIEYERTENNYLKFITKICGQLGVNRMQIVGYEDYLKLCSYHEGQILETVSEICNVAKDCLRENCWCKLVSPKLCIQFGYEYYLYVSSSLELETMNRIVQDFHLFVENTDSPSHLV